MFIGKKNGNIVAFNEFKDDLAINASAKGITFDSIEQTEEPIVPYYNTHNDGIYFKQSEVPEEPADVFNVRQQALRQEQYAILSDPITNHIAVIRDRIAQGDYSSDGERNTMESTIADLYLKRKNIRLQIANDLPYKETGN
jgi:hypothetical protein